MRVLVVEDDESIRESVVDALEFSGFQVVSAPDGMEALRWLAQNPLPCAMVLDLLMPMMTGLDVLESLKGSRPEVIARTVVVSASPNLLRDVTPFGVSVTLSKPFELPALIAAVQKATAS
ncbi:MAG: response regulator [Myxococcota bacterium]|nr:response regulator [Myxococcota bacterium]